MSLILGAAFFVAGIIVGGAVMARFWDSIKNWLNNVAADAVERAFGYSARNNIQKAIAIVDKLVDKIRNTSTIYTKKTPTATYFDKTTVVSEAGIMDIEADVVKTIAEHNNQMVMDFGCAR